MCIRDRFPTSLLLKMKVCFVELFVGQKQLTVSPETAKQSMVELELYNWCGKMLEKLGRCSAKTEEQWYEYIFWQLSVMYKCSQNNEPTLLHPHHKRLIEENILNAIKIYVSDYRKYAGQLNVAELKGNSDDLGINRHLFCKYPFLKKYFVKG
eukprot:TRINITY_DN11365_c0_g1_i15.p1 TRINITY_DN11365_c0_g1~~TRINITY_DN11365_c0_g1_i15.p1  ORF type:complete len:153 (-),score=43.91 TRINITY_DN11365_c0_g1_i15:108-566(-)